jgi:DNA-binding GntR family transcriptional regulator
VVREAVRDESLALALAITAGDEVIRLSRVMCIDNRPTAVFVSPIPAAPELSGTELDASDSEEVNDEWDE